jgi:outer membrane protein TolC
MVSAFTYAEQYDLAAYLAKVEANNLDLALAAKDLESAQVSITMARAAFFPQIGVQGGYTRNVIIKKQPTPVAAIYTKEYGKTGMLPLYKPSEPSGYDNELTFGIGADLTIFDASAITDYRKAKTGAAYNEAVYNRTRQTLLCSAKKHYAQTHLILSMLEIAEAAEKTSEEIYHSVDQKYKVGSATRLDMLNAEVDWKQKGAAASDARKNAGTILISFRSLADLPPDEEIILTETNSDCPQLPSSEGDDIQNILGKRDDYRATLLAGRLADIDKDAAITSFLPTVKAGFSYALAGMGNGGSLVGDYNFDSAALSLTVSIPLFTGGYRLAKLKAAKIEQEKANLSILKKHNDIESELRECRLRYDDAYAQSESALLLVETASLAAELAQRSYNNGLITQLNVTEAADRLSQARLSLESAIYDCFAAYYDWELAAGK